MKEVCAMCKIPFSKQNVEGKCVGWGWVDVRGEGMNATKVHRSALMEVCHDRENWNRKKNVLALTIYQNRYIMSWNDNTSKRCIPSKYGMFVTAEFKNL